jgi:hypothetical protein
VGSLGLLQVGSRWAASSVGGLRTVLPFRWPIPGASALAQMLELRLHGPAETRLDSQQSFRSLPSTTPCRLCSYSCHLYLYRPRSGAVPPTGVSRGTSFATDHGRVTGRSRLMHRPVRTVDQMHSLSCECSRTSTLDLRSAT